MQRRLDSFGPLVGLVVGAYQVGIKDLNAILDTMEDSQLRAMDLARGTEGTEHERAFYFGRTEESS